MKICYCRDNRARNAIIFIILVVLALFIYLKFVYKPHVHIDNGEWTILQQADCTNSGTRCKVCTECGEQFDTETVPAYGHIAAENVVVEKKATCTSIGAGYTICTYCTSRLETVEIPMASHNYEKIEIENEVEHTIVTLPSHEQVVYCTECGDEQSRETIELNHEIEERVTTVVDPTCTEIGYNNIVFFCLDCDKVIEEALEKTAPLGHDFDWVLSRKDNGDFNLSGTCSRGDCDYEHDPLVDTEYSFIIEKDEAASYEATCKHGCDVYVATVYKNGVKDATVSLSITLDIDENHKILTENGEAVDFTTLAKKDAFGTVYFDISTYGIYLKYDQLEGCTDEESRAAAWDSRGFAQGMFKCAVCDKWITVRVYNDLAE